MKGKDPLIKIVAAATAVCICAIILAVTASLYMYQNSASRIVDSVERDYSTAVVLGARVYADGALSPAFRIRVETALALYRSRSVKKIVISADNRPTHWYETDAARAFLVKCGVSDKDILCDFNGYTTFDTMQNLKEQFNITECVIVTQRYHLYRSVYLARKFGIDAVGFAAEDCNGGKKTVHLREYFSNCKALVQVLFFMPKYNKE